MSTVTQKERQPFRTMAKNAVKKDEELRNNP
jgi:hypothetical protein